MASHLNLPGALPHLVEARFNNAKASQALIFSSTYVCTIRTSNNIPFQLRYCPALQKKPTAPKEAGDAPPASTKKADPFENPPQELLIADNVGSKDAQKPAHLLVLNKFPVIPEHFILATKENKPQDHELEKEDVETIWGCLNSWEEGEGSQQLEDKGIGGETKNTSKVELENEEKDRSRSRLFAFFNSGTHSGASQPHRHIQFLPIHSMYTGYSSSSASDWTLLLDLISSQSHNDSTAVEQSSILTNPLPLPFTHFAAHIPPSTSGAQIHTLYKRLLSSAQTSIHPSSPPPNQQNSPPWIPSPVPISYNLALTTHCIALLPRRDEGAMLYAEDEQELGFASLNGTTLGGTLMVKTEAQYEALRKNQRNLDRLLSAIGFPREDQQEVPGYERL